MNAELSNLDVSAATHKQDYTQRKQGQHTSAQLVCVQRLMRAGDSNA
jgi:hypothetical protein